MKQDEEWAVAAMPMLLPVARGERASLLDVIRQELNSGEPLPEESKRRLGGSKHYLATVR